MAKFKIGDRVRAVVDINRFSTKDKFGVVKSIDGAGCRESCVEFDDNIGGHSCFGKCKKNHGLFCRDDELVLVTPKTEIVFTSDNTKFVNAKMYVDGKKVKTATSKCSPEDEFDLKIGIDICTDRLFKKLTKEERQKEAYDNLKIGDIFRLNHMVYKDFDRVCYVHKDELGNKFFVPLTDEGISDFVARGKVAHKTMFCFTSASIEVE